jgi:hypothetical protein
MTARARPPRPQDDPLYKAEVERLYGAHTAGTITTYALNAGRRAALQAARERLGDAGTERAGTPSAASGESAGPSEPTAAEATAPLPEDAGPWAGTPSGPKYWSAAGRGDDPTVRVVHAPTAAGVGSEKAFLFLFGLKRSREIDRKMIERELAELDDDIATLREAGFTVVVDPQGSKQDFLQALYGQGAGVEGLVPAGLYWSAHGHDDGSIECCDAARVSPKDVDTARVSPGLKLVVFGACYTGAWARTWRAALGNHPLVVGWGRPVSIERAVEFLRQNPETDTDLDDLIARYLVGDAPVPAPIASEAPEAAAKHGRITELAERVERIAGVLSATAKPKDTWCDLGIPLPGEREHTVRLFVTHASHEYSEGKTLVAAEAEIGELTPLVETQALLGALAGPGFARISLVRGSADLPVVVAQGFMPLRHATDLEIAALAYEVALVADRLQQELFDGARWA